MHRDHIRGKEGTSMLTEKQRQLISESYVYISRREYSTGEMFYNRLFEIAPDLQQLFPDEMKAMRLKFIQMGNGDR
jgi:hemoglobin-like flavoprotein